MHPSWDQRQSPIKQLSGATSADSGTTTAFRQSCPSCHHPLQVFIHQGDALRWWLLTPAGLKPPGLQPRQRPSGGALASEGLRFQSFNSRKSPNFISTFTPDTCSRSTRLWDRWIPSHQNRLRSSSELQPPKSRQSSCRLFWGEGGEEGVLAPPN